MPRRCDFRDFRKTKGKTGASGVFAVKAPARRDRSLAGSDIPRDITPDELDASAPWRELDGPIPAAEILRRLRKEWARQFAVTHAAAKTEAAELKVASLNR